MAVAAVIVTYNSADVINSCLEALSKMSPGMTAIIVDNASSDNTLDLVRSRSGVHVIANSENRGFAAAVNQGVREAGASEAQEGEFVLLLNPDVELADTCRPVDGIRAVVWARGGPFSGPGRPHPGGVHAAPLPDSGSAGLRTVRDQPAVAIESDKPPVPLFGSGLRSTGDGRAARGSFPDGPAGRLEKAGRLRRAVLSGLVRGRGFLPKGSE